MVYPLIALLISSFTTVGLLSLWAATSRRHWFLRTSVFSGVLSLLLLIPAYEPAVAFALQGMVVVAGVQITRWVRRTRPVRFRRFSMATLLQVTALISVLAAVGVKLPELNVSAWSNVVLIGVVAGFTTLVGCWVARGQSLRWYLRLVIGLFLAVGILLPPLQYDNFSFTALGNRNWPHFTNYSYFGLGNKNPYEFRLEKAALNCWWQAIPGTLVALIFSIGFVTSAFSTVSKGQWSRRWSRYLLLPFLILLLAPAGYVYYQLMKPLPMLVQALEENGYDDLLEASDLAEEYMENKKSYELDPQWISLVNLQTTVQELQPVYKKIQTALAKKNQWHLGITRFQSALYSSRFGPAVPDFKTVRFRLLDHCFRFQVALAVRERRIQDALESCFDTVHLGFVIRKGGNRDCVLQGFAVADDGFREIYNLRVELNSQQLLSSMILIEQWTNESDPLSVIIDHDFAFLRQDHGWHDQLAHLLLAVEQDLYAYDRNVLLRDRTVTRLLSTELAVFAFRLEQGHLPERLEELVPKYLLEVPSDPYSLDDALLRYRRKDQTFVLYSIGNNGVDDGGKPTQDELGEFGDLILNDIYASELMMEKGD